MVLLLLLLGDLSECFVDVAENNVLLRAITRIGSKRKRSCESDVFWSRQ